MKCPKCKNKISADETRCPVCGKRITSASQNTGAIVSIPITIGCISIIFAFISLYAVLDSYFGIRGNLHAFIYACSILIAGILNIIGMKKRTFQILATIFHGIALVSLFIEILLFASSIWMIVIQMIVFVLNIVYITKIK